MNAQYHLKKMKVTEEEIAFCLAKEGIELQKKADLLSAIFGKK